jgi:hypothetical protein
LSCDIVRSSCPPALLGSVLAKHSASACAARKLPNAVNKCPRSARTLPIFLMRHRQLGLPVGALCARRASPIFSGDTARSRCQSAFPGSASARRSAVVSASRYLSSVVGRLPWRTSTLPPFSNASAGSRGPSASPGSALVAGAVGAAAVSVGGTASASCNWPKCSWRSFARRAALQSGVGDGRQTKVTYGASEVGAPANLQRQAACLGRRLHQSEHDDTDSSAQKHDGPHHRRKPIAEPRPCLRARRRTGGRICPHVAPGAHYSGPRSFGTGAPARPGRRLPSLQCPRFAHAAACVDQRHLGSRTCFATMQSWPTRRLGLTTCVTYSTAPPRPSA